MITRFITEITTKFNPFAASARSARLFLTNIPPSARAQGTLITTKLLSPSAAEKTSLQVKFSTASPALSSLCLFFYAKMPPAPPKDLKKEEN